MQSLLRLQGLRSSKLSGGSAPMHAHARVQRTPRASTRATPSSRRVARQQTTSIIDRPPVSTDAPSSTPSLAEAAASDPSSSSALSPPAVYLGPSWATPLGNLLLVQQLSQALLKLDTPLSSPPSVGITSAVHHPATCAVALALFALISYDVIAPSSAHLLPQLDTAVHQWVVNHTDLTFRATTADLFISDLFITAGIWGWLASTCITLAAAPRPAALPLGAAWLAYYTTCGAVFTDPPLVNSLKHAFARIRPSTLHHTYSFPSGHTSAAVFIAGMLLVVLLPMASASLQLAKQRWLHSRKEQQHTDSHSQQQQQQHTSSHSQQQVHGDVSNSISSTPGMRVVAAATTAAAVPDCSSSSDGNAARDSRQQQQQQQEWQDSNVLPACSSSNGGDAHASRQQQWQDSSANVHHQLVHNQHQLQLSRSWLPDSQVLGWWGAAWVVTATGRVLADAHWASDTLAGGCLAVGVVSGLACATSWLQQGLVTRK